MLSQNFAICDRTADALPEPVDALVTDVMMPHLSAPPLAKRIRRTRSDLRVLFMSGYIDSLKPALLVTPGTTLIHNLFGLNNLVWPLRDILDQLVEAQGYGGFS
jgi:DNA-binding response OmpR family regulator